MLHDRHGREMFLRFQEYTPGMKKKRRVECAAPSLQLIWIRAIIHNSSIGIIIQYIMTQVTNNLNNALGIWKIGGGNNGCTYKGFVACGPRDFDGTGGAVALTRWIEKMESVIDNSGCLANQRVKSAILTAWDIDSDDGSRRMDWLSNPKGLCDLCHEKIVRILVEGGKVLYVQGEAYSDSPQYRLLRIRDAQELSRSNFKSCQEMGHLIVGQVNTPWGAPVLFVRRRIDRFAMMHTRDYREVGYAKFSDVREFWLQEVHFFRHVVNHEVIENFSKIAKPLTSLAKKN
ncbi:hypothetical protein Tco_0162587 [Tanacetum coccineum]